MLYVVGTPIGNLKDITLRALETLKNADYILCEDTRHSLKLLTHYEIKKPLVAYHKFNEREGAEKVIADLKEGKEIALKQFIQGINVKTRDNTLEYLLLFILEAFSI